ncbi:hypothetical protein Acsp06_60100 [Actinomycetospora sp. NBRC 106375]|uniref:hypothetical protein n=1 Tax=Actinomycetospora sp. NBRC 106375 TaxID=3032207 RepID=UPI0024A36C05|nr:hypothetical protein [Actinomycetospora sp. NBRC 106375]GLZ49825.1 hypothetical protein Acsp06_60100 [Actinomycetospora sp. NBRC 106375]
MIDVLSRLDEVKQKTAAALTAVTEDSGASPVLVAVVREFDAKAAKATAASDGASRDAVIELEQAADSARVAAAAETGLGGGARDVVEDAHLAICVLKTEV